MDEYRIQFINRLNELLLKEGKVSEIYYSTITKEKENSDELECYYYYKRGDLYFEGCTWFYPTPKSIENRARDIASVW